MKRSANGSKKSRKQTNAPAVVHQASAKAADLQECSVDTRAYHHGLLDGQHRAELFLLDLRQSPWMTGSGGMNDYLNEIRPALKNPRKQGMMVGFCSRIERELANAAADRAWRDASSQDRWKFLRTIASPEYDPAKEQEVLERIEAKISKGQEISPTDWRDMLTALAPEALAIARRTIDAMVASKRETATTSAPK